MNAHADSWIDAYLDGALNPSQVRQADTHLRECPRCRALLEERQALSALLQEVPPAANLKPERQFVAEVGLRLARRQDVAASGDWRTSRQTSALRAAWMLAPAALLLAWAFVQTVLILSTLVGLVPGAGHLLVQRASLDPGLLAAAAAGLGVSFPALPEVLTEWIGYFGLFNIFHWDLLTGFIALIFIGGLSAAWLAGWWVVRKNADGQAER